MLRTSNLILYYVSNIHVRQILINTDKQLTQTNIGIVKTLYTILSSKYYNKIVGKLKLVW